MVRTAVRPRSNDDPQLGHPRSLTARIVADQIRRRAVLSNEEAPPDLPSGRQDLNLRPLDPQGGPASALTSGNRLCAGCSRAVGRSSGCSGRFTGSTVCSRSAPPTTVKTLRAAVSERALDSALRRAAVPCEVLERYAPTGLRRTLGQGAPSRPLHHRATNKIHKVRRRDRLGGLVREYQQVA
jgi:hypothetical protein